MKKEASIFEELPTYAVEISPVSFDLGTLPMRYEQQQEIKNEILPAFSSDILFTAVSVPNPHLIGIVDSKYIQDATHHQQLATYLNGENDYFPDGVNVSYVYPISKSEIFVKTFERGVGFTNACGTAMTASALIAKMYDYVNVNKVTVYNPGGFVQCQVEIDNGVYKLSLIGNATVTAEYKVESVDEIYQKLSCFSTEEHVQYEKCNIFVKGKLGILI